MSDAARAAHDPSRAGDETRQDAGGLLRALPEACTLLSESDAGVILRGTATSMMVVHSGMERSSCRYTTSDRNVLGIQLLFVPFEVHDPASDPPERMRSFLEASGWSVDGALEAPGHGGFYHEAAGSTAAYVLTGIRGTAVISDRPVAQLHLQVELTSPDAPERRLDLIRGAVDQILGGITTVPR